MEPLGIIVFAAVITTSFSQVLVSSVEQLTEEKRQVTHVDLSPLSLALLAANIIIKGILWIWCLTIKGSSSVKALAQDHENDVVFNIASTLFPLAGKYIYLQMFMSNLLTIITLQLFGQRDPGLIQLVLLYFHYTLFMNGYLSY